MSSPIDSFTYRKPPEPSPEELATRGLSLFHQGCERINVGDKSSAFRDFTASVTENPGVAGSWFNLATALDEAKSHKAAVAFARRCVEIWPDNPQANANLGWYLHLTGEHDESKEWLDKSLNLDPLKALTWSFLGQHHMAKRNAKDAIECSRKAFEIEPNNPLFPMALSFACMLNGEWEEGLSLYEWRFKYKLPEFLTYPYPLWRGESIQGQRLFIVSEQGLGDTLQFSRYVHSLKKLGAREIIFAVQAPLQRIIEQNFKFCKVISLPCPLPDAEWFCPLISLPVVLGGNPVDWTGGKVQYRPLSIPQDTSRLRKVPGRKLHVGIAWAGDPTHDSDRFRSALLDDFLELQKIPSLQLYGLQFGQRAKDIEGLGCIGLIPDQSVNIRDMSDTASIMRSLDLVITVDTSVAHLAGSCGRPVWVLLPYNGLDWRWTYEGESSVWYPSAKLIRQQEGETWKHTMKRVVEMLKGYKP